MKTKNTRQLILALALIGGIAQANDTIETAPTVSVGTTLNWAINPAGDVDIARYELSSRGMLRAWTTGSLDTVGEILDSAGRPIVFGDDYGNDLNFNISATLNPGTYYVKTKAYSPWSTGNYGLYTSFVPTPPVDDHGSTIASPTRVSLNGGTADVRGTLERNGDLDFFAFTVPQAGRITFTSGGTTDVVGTLYNSAGGWLAYDDDGAGVGHNFRLGTSVTAGQTVYVAVGGYNNVTTGSYTVAASFTPAAQPVPAKRALVIGISDYPGTSNDLTYCDDDARDMAALLRSQGWSVTTLIDSQAGKAAIERETRRLAPGGGQFLLVYSGHGSASGTTGYICPADMNSTITSFISENEINRYLANAGNTQIGFIFDSCNSGAFIGRNLAGATRLPAGTKARYVQALDGAPVDLRAGEFFARNISTNNRVAIMGCRGSQFSMESPAWSHGWLTWKLLSAFRNRALDTNRNLNISLEESFSTVAAGNFYYGERQDPQLYDGNGATHFEVTRP